MNETRLSTLKMATEATSFVDFHLVDFMASRKDLAPFHPSIYQFNPKRVQNFKTAYSDKEKTDDAGASVIADRLRFSRLPESHESHEPYLPLKRLTRYRFHIVKAINRERAYFLTYFYLKFSGFSVKKPFASLFGATSLTLITEFSPDELIHLPPGRSHPVHDQKWEEPYQSTRRSGIGCQKGSLRILETETTALSSSINLILGTIL